MIVQEFQKKVLTNGELSFIVISGRFTHAVIKKAKKNDYRVQDDYGGTVSIYSPKKEEIMFAENVVKKCSPTPLYARVDVLFNESGHLLLSELELIEPELWFRFCDSSATLLAKKIASYIR